MTRASSLRSRLAPIRRRGLVVLTTILLVMGIAYLTASARSGTYTGEAIMLVPSGARGDDPGRADEAAKLAGTYALAIPQAARIRQSVADSLGVSPVKARDHMSVANDANTAILRLRYTASSGRVAAQGARAMVQAVLARSAWKTIRRGSLVLVRPPDRPSHQSAGTLTPLVVGLFCGIFLSIVLLVGLERSDARIDDVAELGAESPCPVSAIDERSKGTIVAVLERWRRLLDKPVGQIAILPCTPSLARRANEVVSLLAQVRDESSENSSGRDAEPGKLWFKVGDAPGSEGAGEALALEADLTVLVVGEGTRVRDVRGAIDVLSQFGVSPAWMFFVTPRERKAPGLLVPGRTAAAGVSDGPARA